MEYLQLIGNLKFLLLLVERNNLTDIYINMPGQEMENMKIIIEKSTHFEPRQP